MSEETRIELVDTNGGPSLSGPRMTVAAFASLDVQFEYRFEAQEPWRRFELFTLLRRFTYGGRKGARARLRLRDFPITVVVSRDGQELGRKSARGFE